MAARVHRRTVPGPDLGHVEEVRLPDRPILRRGVEATVKLPERTTGKRLRFMRGESDGSLTFSDGGRFRTVPADAVIRVHIGTKLR